MNKNYKIVTINGIRGMIAVVLIVLGLIAGFIISPGWVCMMSWNYFFEDSNTVSQMQLYQGIMLWAVIALSLYALNNKRPLIGIGTYQGLNPEQIKDIMERARKTESKFFKELEEKAKNNVNIVENKIPEFAPPNEETKTVDEKEEVRR